MNCSIESCRPNAAFPLDNWYVWPNCSRPHSYTYLQPAKSHPRFQILIARSGPMHDTESQIDWDNNYAAIELCEKNCQTKLRFKIARLNSRNQNRSYHLKRKQQKRLQLPLNVHVYFLHVCITWSEKCSCSCAHVYEASWWHPALGGWFYSSTFKCKFSLFLFHFSFSVFSLPHWYNKIVFAKTFML